MGRVQVFNNGIAKYEQLLESLQDAQKTIDLEYFIFRNDQIGNRITELLIEKALTGVQVRFMRDGLGSYKFPREKIRQMVEAGIECRTIFPLRFPWFLSNWNYRDHCKMAIIDGKIAFNGGINIGYEYTGLKPDVGFWRDTHLQVIGEASADLQPVFDVHWEIAVPERIKSKTNLKTKSEVTKINPIVRADYSKWSAELGSELSTLDDKEMDMFAKTQRV